MKTLKEKKKKILLGIQTDLSQHYTQPTINYVIKVGEFTFIFVCVSSTTIICESNEKDLKL